MELEKLRVQFKIAEEVEKEEKDKEHKTCSKEETEKKDDVKPADNNSPPDTAPAASLTNGVDDKVKLVNGHVSIDSDATAVNTPLGSSTPLPTIVATAISATETNESETVVLTAEILRLQILHLEKLLKFLEQEFAPTRQKLKDLLAGNDMKFSLLWCLFRLGSVITFKDYESGLNMAGEVFSIFYFYLIADYGCRLYASW